jgi:predicted dinucleotide-binding enzyme
MPRLYVRRRRNKCRWQSDDINPVDREDLWLMQIGIIGSGKIGATAARLLAGAGHDVAIANSRGPETLTDLVGNLGERASPATVEDATTSTELVAAHLPDARVVQAFNSMQWIALRERSSQGPMDERLVLFVAGDDEEAKGRVSGLIEEIGFAPIDTGSLAEGGRRQQPGRRWLSKELRLTEARDLLGKTE